MASEKGELSEQIDALGEVRSALEDLNVKHVTIAPSGKWSFEKLGRLRKSSRSSDATAVGSLARLVEDSGPVHWNGWAIRAYPGVAGYSLLFERLPTAIVERLPETVLSRLKREVRQGGNGVVVGPPGSGKAAILLWLALQIPDEPVLFISENPPTELPGGHVTHVYPPRNDRRRRDLERLVRLSGTVMWDRVANASDIRTVFGFAGARKRWFTIDSTSIRSGLRAILGAMQLGCDGRFHTMISLESSVIGRPEVQNLAVYDDGEWEEPFAAGESCLPLLSSFGEQDIRSLGMMEFSTPLEHEVMRDSGDHTTLEEEGEPAHPREPEEPPRELGAEPSGAGIRKRPGQGTQDFESPLTIPVEYEEADDTQLAAAGVREEVLRSASQDDARESGEIDLARYRRMKEEAVPGEIPEETRQYIQPPEELAQKVDEAPNAPGDDTEDSLDGLIPGLEFDKANDEQSINLDNLRITRIEEISEEELEMLEELREGSDYSEVFEEELDFEELVDVSEVSEADTSVAPGELSEAYQDAGWDEPDDETVRNVIIKDGNTAPQVEHRDSGSQPNISGDSGATEEYAMNEKIRRIRRNLKKDDSE